MVTEKIIGTWKLVSWTYLDKNGDRVNFFGEESCGILMYDRSGYMNAQLMKLPRKKLGAGSLFAGSDEAVAGAYRTYAAYWGKYHEQAPGELIHVVEGSLFPDWVGTREVRYARIENEELILSAPPVDMDGHRTIFDVRWRRA